MDELIGVIILPDKPLSVKPESVVSGHGGALPSCVTSLQRAFSPKGDACPLFNHCCRSPGPLGLGCEPFDAYSAHPSSPGRIDCPMMSETG